MEYIKKIIKIMIFMVKYLIQMRRFYMTIAEAERFYKQDTKKYEISKNKELLTWLKEAIKNGYHSFIDIEYLQELIDNIACWYEIKYPEREMEFYEGIRHFDFENIESLSKVMDIKQLMYRLPHKQLCLMKCDYRSIGGGIRDIYNDKGEVVGHKTILFMQIDRKNVEYNPLSMCDKLPDFLLQADTVSGKVHVDYNLKEYVSAYSITLDELLILFKEKYISDLDFTNLEECIYDHNCDLELRRRILQLVALKLLYSNRTTPERGYERARRFINEFNKKMGLNLTTEEIDEAINKDYSNGEKWEHVLKTYIDDNDEEHSYWTIENVAKNEEKELGKVRNLVKSIFRK